jgi:hypothetical protein
MGYKAAKAMMPQTSETERIALGCGTVGFDREIFTGSPSLKPLFDTCVASSLARTAIVCWCCLTFVVP